MNDKQIISELEFLEFQKKVKKFKKDAKDHINYLIIIMFIIMIYFIEIKFFSDFQFCVVSFLTIFQIAFTKNMLLNVPSR